MNHEIWKSNAQFPNYEVSNLGRIRSLYAGLKLPAGHIHKGQLDKDGYHVVGLRIDGFLKLRKMHRLVVTAFIRDMLPKEQVNHLNGKKADNRLENLEICNQSQNTRHAFDVLGRIGKNNPKKGSQNGNARLDESDIRAIRALYRKGLLQKDIARKFRIRQTSVSNIVLRISWKHVA